MEDSVAVEAIDVPLWSWLIAAFAVFSLYVLTLDNGAVLAEAANTVHELVHDARHFVGVPCH